MRGLAPVWVGQRFDRVTLHRADLRRPFPDGLGQRLTGATVIACRRRAKYGLVDTDRGDTMMLHLGMSGRMRVDPRKHRQARPCRVRNRQWPGGGVQRCPALRLARSGRDRDCRRAPAAGRHRAGAAGSGFRRWRCWCAPLPTGWPPPRRCCSISGSSPGWAISMSARRCSAPASTRRAPVARWRAARLKALAAAVPQVLEEAIAAGGSSLRDHAAPDGTLGYFQKTFSVYGQEGNACPTCATPVERHRPVGAIEFLLPAMPGLVDRISVAAMRLPFRWRVSRRRSGHVPGNRTNRFRFIGRTWPIRPRLKSASAATTAAPKSTRRASAVSAPSSRRSNRPSLAAIAAAAAAALAAAQPEMMRGVSKGVLHKNTVARKISRLAKRAKALATA